MIFLQVVEILSQKQTSISNDKTESLNRKKSGVPQGSELGPLIFVNLTSSEILTKGLFTQK